MQSGYNGEKGGDRLLFRKKMARSCSYCAHAGKLNQEQMICQKKGVVSIYESCRRFRYDPLKRVPARPKAKDFSQFADKDFSL